PPEFVLRRFTPEPWSGPDVVVWQKMMAWDLSANYAWELLRHDLVAKLGPERMADLMPPYARNGLSILTQRDLETAGIRMDGGARISRSHAIIFCQTTTSGPLQGSGVKRSRTNSGGNAGRSARKAFTPAT